MLELRAHCYFVFASRIYVTILDCGKTFRGNGIIRSPQYPNDYRANEGCVYKIRAPENYRIRLDFVTFNLEAGVQCENDALEIYEVQANGRRVFEKHICGSLRPNDYISRSNNIDLYLKSDSRNQFSGFYIDYTTEKVIITTTNPTTTTTTPTTSTQGRHKFCLL